MKKIIAIAGLMLIGISLMAEQISYTTTTNGTYLITTNRANVYNVQIASLYNASVKFYSASSVDDPYFGTNYVTSAYVKRTQYSTNYVTSYVGYNGYTNWYTNAGIWTVVSTNAAATNALNPMLTFNVLAGTYSVLDTDAIFERGICILADTNVSIVISYRKSQ